MKELKTLKDLDLICWDEEGGRPICECQLNILEKEIIKYLIELELGTHPLFTNFTVSQCEACSNLLKHIFNLTDEELGIKLAKLREGSNGQKEN